MLSLDVEPLREGARPLPTCHNTVATVKAAVSFSLKKPVFFFLKNTIRIQSVL